MKRLDVLLAGLLAVTIPLGVQAEAPSPKPTAGKDQKQLIDLNMGGKGDPTYVSSKSLTLKSNERLFRYEGDVKVTRGDLTMTCDQLDGTYSENNEISTLVARNKVVMTKGTDMKATSNKATFDKRSNTLTLTESPELTREKSVLTADKITIFLDDDRSIAEGEVRVKMVASEQSEKSMLGPVIKK